MAEQHVNEYDPEAVSPPGETLQETIDALQMSQAELAERMGRPKKTINEIIKGKAAITADTALQLEMVLGVPASFWSNRERLYRENLARRQDNERLLLGVEWPKRFPIAEMVKLGWLKTASDPVSQLRSLLRFFGIASPEQWEGAYAEALCRKSKTSKPGPASVWFRAGELVAHEIVCEPFDADLFKTTLLRVRAITRTDPQHFKKPLVEACAQAGVALAFVHELPSSGIAGATRWLTPTKALIQLSLRYKLHDQLWFTFFHEAAHILLHGKTRMFLEGEDELQDPKLEEEADKFARDILIPLNEYTRFVSQAQGVFTAGSVRTFAEIIGVAPGIVVGRLQHDNLLGFDRLHQLRTRLKWA
jgi:HTH-type transcriptional regulator/antitoxin HigA